MRSILLFTLAFLIAACGSGPREATTGPDIAALMAASWPTAAPARQSAFSRDGRLLATSDASGLVSVRDTRSWRVLEQFKHPGGATAVAFSRDGAELFSAGYDGTIKQWDLRRRALARTLRGPNGTIWTVDVSPDGARLAAAGEDTIIRIWDLDRASDPAQLRGHARNVWVVRFSPDGTRLASGSFDDSVRLWDAQTGRPLKTLRGHSAAVVGLDYSPDRKLLATGADDSTIRFWRASDGATLRTINNGYHVDKVEFSPDGRWPASGGHARGGVAEVWHQLTGGGGNGPAVRIWRTNDAALVAALPHPDDVIFVTFSPDGRWLVTSGEDNRFRLWRLQRARG